jgi:glycosyltransferase involved in cell wall biosynthesis
MRVVHLSSYDINGGAARAAWRVHDSLRMVGVDSSMFVSVREGYDPKVEQYVPSPGAVVRLNRIVRRDLLRRELQSASRARPSGFDDFRDDRTIFGSEVAQSAPDADIYHLHQITDFVDYRSCLPVLARRAPIVWTLHEMTPLTGGCHYAYDCTHFTGECGECPQLGRSNRRDFSHSVWRRKQMVYGGIPRERLHVVGPSRWIASEAARSSLLGRYPVSVIPYGLDTDLYHPMPEARHLIEAFGIAPSTRVVLFVADWTSVRRKGFELLDAALGALCHSSKTALISLGRGDSPRLQSKLTHIHLGSLTDDRMIAAVYSMADVFVIPSLQDNLPNAVLEAMACGSAVVGFNIGGIPDMVRDGVNGLLAPEGDVKGLAEAIQTLLGDDERRRAMGKAAREIAEREYSRRLQGDRYVELYRSLSASARGAAGDRRTASAGPA